MPMKDAVEQVLKAEAEGKKLIAEARLKAETMLLEAESRAREIEEAAVKSANERASHLKEEARRECEARREKILADIQVRIQQEKREKESRITEAVQKALEFILGETG
jgi:vacuolar-type H+-ATPase subunit H